jgi:hypothetical protein
MPYLHSLIFENVHEHGSSIVKLLIITQDIAQIDC